MSSFFSLGDTTVVHELINELDWSETQISSDSTAAGLRAIRIRCMQKQGRSIIPTVGLKVRTPSFPSSSLPPPNPTNTSTGAVDYIFGAASAWFGECDIVSTGAGYITANSREESSDSSWYAIDSSTITAASGVDLTGEVYLGRPWRVLARVIYQNSELSGIINSEGWTTMAENATPLFYEYNNSGDGAGTEDRKYESQIDGAVDIGTVLGSGYSDWIDGSY